MLDWVPGLIWTRATVSREQYCWYHTIDYTTTITPPPAATKTTIGTVAPPNEYRPASLHSVIHLPSVRHCAGLSDRQTVRSSETTDTSPPKPFTVVFIRTACCATTRPPREALNTYTCTVGVSSVRGAHPITAVRCSVHTQYSILFVSLLPNPYWPRPPRREIPLPPPTTLGRLVPVVCQSPLSLVIHRPNPLYISSFHLVCFTTLLSDKLLLCTLSRRSACSTCIPRSTFPNSTRDMVQAALAANRATSPLYTRQLIPPAACESSSSFVSHRILPSPAHPSPEEVVSSLVPP
ncbi:hypothetical protein EJ05DRAFT_400483 [Pseudovirgaria hyperparasitica]|uniref:Uncharacterized protein n=1 Tax=Pseudovirgaria hyperparasitica TaxID=470096 RepID=A0A6A6W598_9PEZI|nr:uncharacterized protein EJ05DRAFT_400483 [Pseudovirgaria hyperparasitica]KAF2757773.1 hypothetical protein EJ05DRAFT_400483 [Pseudovirgaria hyperparasitica]